MKQKLGLVLRITGIITIVFGFMGFIFSGFKFVLNDGRGISPIVFFMIFFIGMIILTISSFISNGDRLKHFKNIENTISDNIKDLLDTDKQSKTHTCEYCGCTISSENIKCPNCGANIKH